MRNEYKRLMNVQNKRIIWILLGAIILFIGGFCITTPNLVSAADESDMILIKPDVNLIYVGQTIQFELANATGEVTWSVSPKYAEIDENGLLTATKEGNISVYAYSDDEHVIDIKIREPYINYPVAELLVGEKLKLKVTGTTAVTFTSSNQTVVKVSKKGTITAVKAGTATIKVKCENGDTYKCKVTVYKTVNIKNAKVGDTVYFGTYEQDNNLKNGQEKIVWDVLQVKDSKALLVSHKILDWKVYYETQSKTTWKNSSIRTWLNKEFISTAFSKAEKKLLLETTISNPSNPVFGTTGGANTKDKVFLLSTKEVMKYWPSKDGQIECTAAAKATKYAIAKGAFTVTPREFAIDEYTKLGYKGYMIDCANYLLRTPGYKTFIESTVMNDGTINNFGTYNGEASGIRPALWVKVK